MPRDSVDREEPTESGEEPGSTAPRDGGSGESTDPRESTDAAIGRGLLDEEMGPSSAMAHLYRGEIHRMKFWRERLDRTTNWAVLVLAGVLTWAFSDRTHPHYLLLVGVAALCVFLLIEARRYRGYDIWRSRVRTLQQNVFAPGLDPERSVADDDWRSRLADDYDRPTLKISSEEAVAHRLRRVYLPLTLVVILAWVARVVAFAHRPWPASAAVGSIPGLVVTVAVGVTVATLVVVACRPRTWHGHEELRTEQLRRDDE